MCRSPASKPAQALLERRQSRHCPFPTSEPTGDMSPPGPWEPQTSTGVLKASARPLAVQPQLLTAQRSLPAVATFAARGKPRFPKLRRSSWSSAKFISPGIEQYRPHTYTHAHRGVPHKPFKITPNNHRNQCTSAPKVMLPPGEKERLKPLWPWDECTDCGWAKSSTTQETQTQE